MARNCFFNSASSRASLSILSLSAISILRLFLLGVFESRSVMEKGSGMVIVGDHSFDLPFVSCSMSGSYGA